MSELEQFTGRLDHVRPRCGMISSSDEEDVEDLNSFGVLRGPMRERAVMLELRKRNGNFLAIPYAWIERIEFDPSEGITIRIGGQAIRIKGRNLNAEVCSGQSLFMCMARQRMLWVAEVASNETHTIGGGSDRPAVDAIEV